MKFIFTALSVATLTTAASINKRADECLTACVQSVEAKGEVCTKYGPDEENISRCICQQGSSYWEPLWACAQKCPAYSQMNFSWEGAKPLYCAMHPGEPTEPESGAANLAAKQTKTSEEAAKETTSAQEAPKETKSEEAPKETKSEEAPKETQSQEAPEETETPDVTQHNAGAAVGVGSVAYLLALAMI
ncbi:uncharacterized protein SPAPADRAFT_60009 [Spathaspora passalidarum NRRL Y-27907]|uniref:Extracellular membrane protein CFEM domain-containing protein n=1 Tax=Spathaspora passalidarum (strain NRRL Y-27907 / 11-Y1) TaxID=619300 RepID=G3AJC1_SPAPN|nr:uncharacterized protein SPAPADRAFT_60009 [Spathaspora passalidarum NRRL Y-27907]EGW34580.1 hypothetical protein SPAPADRAFT_60009 [Spathaspora passalidarum NRRL Y-27907]